MSLITLEPSAARAYWRALLDNATSLVADAHLLFDNRSFGRARALTVLAEEELAKALSVYELFNDAWSVGGVDAREWQTLGARDHLAKYRAAFEFGRELESFWGEYPALDDHPDDDNWEQWAADRRALADDAARRANESKKRGFYVDLVGSEVLTPDAMDPEGVGVDLNRAAQVIEMMLIGDHTRMQDGPPERYDSTHDLQWRVMPTSHPEEFADFVARVGAERSALRRLEDLPSGVKPSEGSTDRA